MPPAPKGHNSEVVAGKDLKTLITRVEKLIEDRRAISEDISEVKREAKNKGFDMSTFNAMIKLRAMDAETRQEKEELREIYISSLGLC